MRRKTSHEISLPKGVYVCNLSYPLTFVGLPRFVSAILEGKPGDARAVIFNIEENTFVSESDLAVVGLAAERLSAHAILPLLVLPGGCAQASCYVKRKGGPRTFMSLQTALDYAKSLPS